MAAVLLRRSSLEALTPGSEQNLQACAEFASVMHLVFYCLSIFVLVREILFQVVILAFVEGDICYEDIYVRSSATALKSAAIH